jgi:phage baseplate assembly protein W
MADIPHFAFPFARGVHVEQDSAEHIMSCENVIVRCPVGFRVERPDFGIPWPEYATAVDENVVLATIRRLEGRSTLSAEQARDLLGDVTITINVEVP